MFTALAVNMPEGIPEIVKRITLAVKERLPWDPVGKKKRAIKPFPKDIVPNKSQVRIVPDEAEHDPNSLPDLSQNIKASEQFIKSIRNPSLYNQDPYNPQYMKSDLGFLVGKPVEKSWFDVASVVKTAEDRYKLPLAIFIDRNHARLVVKGAYQTLEGRKVMVYNPMSNGFEEVSVDKTGMLAGVTANALVRGKVDNGEYMPCFMDLNPGILNLKQEGLNSLSKTSELKFLQGKRFYLNTE